MTNRHNQYVDDEDDVRTLIKIGASTFAYAAFVYWLGTVLGFVPSLGTGYGPVAESVMVGAGVMLGILLLGTSLAVVMASYIVWRYGHRITFTEVENDVEE